MLLYNNRFYYIDGGLNNSLIVNGMHSKFSLPKKPDDLLNVWNKILEKHFEEGPHSPLQSSKIAIINFKLKNAISAHNQGTLYQKLAEQAFAERDQFIKSEKSKLATYLKDVYKALLIAHNGKWKKLAMWGFKFREARKWLNYLI